MNKMTAANLAVVFGPNLVWSNDKTMSLTSIGKLNVWFQVVFGPNLVWTNGMTMSLTSIGKLYVWVQVVFFLVQ
jgi:hypothetical protein